MIIKNSVFLGFVRNLLPENKRIWSDDKEKYGGLYTLNFIKPVI